MAHEGYSRLKQIVLEASECTGAERTAYLDEACRGDPDFRREVEALLEHEDGTGGILRTAGAAPQTPSGPDTPTQAADPRLLPSPSFETPEQIGPYRILERIGEGGMGIVYAAEQTEPIRRKVALKVIKPGMDSGEVLARFEAERQALALMDHPNIAHIHDAGTTEQGLPYFVMEHVPGIPITDYADQRRLTTEERLRLFQKVCDGVQHAHQKAVIHRDLKPSNILVVDQDGEPVPKIIDFGVAKATTQKLTERTMYTSAGQLVGTPEYMSPEQADFTGDVDTRTDVYSLGVVLYQLLTGALPFEPERFRDSGLEGIIKLLREEEPQRPSTKVSTLGERTPEVAKARRVEARQLTSQLRGDLDWIVMRCLEKDRNRRYGTPRELAQDIGRHLEHRPVLAGPPSAAYRTKKFVRRHRVGVGFTATVSAAVMVGFVLVAAQNAKIAAARNEAELVTSTLEEMLASVDPTKSGRDVTVREMLDEAARTLGEKFQDQPLVEARLRHTVGKTYQALGEFDAAEEHLRRAAKIRGNYLREEDPTTLETRLDLAWTYARQARYKEAEALAGETLKISRRFLGGDHPQTLQAMHTLGVSYGMQGRSAEAEPLYREALEIGRRVLGNEHPETLRSMHGLGLWCAKFGSLEEGEALLRETFEIERRVSGEEHPGTLLTTLNLSYCYMRRGRYEEAEALARKNLEIARRVLGDEHLTTLLHMGNLADSCVGQGRYDEAEALQREQTEIMRHVLGEEHPRTLNALSGLGITYVHQRRFEEGEALLRRALEIRRRVLGEEHSSTLKTMGDLTFACWQLGRRDEAETLREEQLQIRRRTLGEDHPETLESMRLRASQILNLDRYDEAEPLSRKTLEISRHVLGEDDERTNDLRHILACALAMQGHRSEAISLLQDAVDNGYRRGDILDDSDFVSLHDDPEFEAIVAELKRRN